MGFMIGCRCQCGQCAVDLTKPLSPAGAGDNLVGTEDTSVGTWDGNSQLVFEQLFPSVSSPTLLEPIRFSWRANSGTIDVHNTHRVRRGGMIMNSSVTTGSGVNEGAVTQCDTFCPVAMQGQVTAVSPSAGVGYLQEVNWKYARCHKNGTAISELITVDSALLGPLGMNAIVPGSNPYGGTFKIYTEDEVEIECVANLEYGDVFGVDIWIELVHDGNSPGAFPFNRWILQAGNGFFDPAELVDDRTAEYGRCTYSPVGYDISCTCPDYKLTWAASTTLRINGQDEAWDFAAPGAGWETNGTCGATASVTSSGVTMVDLRLTQELPTLALRDPASPGIGDVLYTAEDHSAVYGDMTGALTPVRDFEQGVWDESALPITFIVNDDTINQTIPPAAHVMPAGWPTSIVVDKI